MSRSQFRSTTGCCICATKSSSSRFSNSYRFSQYFSKCFGPRGEGRNGDICNACVLYVKRWLKASDQSCGKYEKVLDKKKGPGLKHITQIVKMQQRRQARLKLIGQQCGHGMETRSKNQNTFSANSNHSSSCLNANKDRLDKDCYVFYSEYSPIELSDGCNKSGGSSLSSRSFLSLSSLDQSISSRPCCSRDFRDKNLGDLSQNSLEMGVFRVPEPKRTKTPTTNYKRRVHLPPVKLPNADEVDLLLREIMAINSEVVNFEIPLAMQNHLRLRNRTIMPVRLNSGNQGSCNTSNDQASVSSDSFGSSVGNLDSLHN